VLGQPLDHGRWSWCLDIRIIHRDPKVGPTSILWQPTTTVRFVKSRLWPTCANPIPTALWACRTGMKTIDLWCTHVVPAKERHIHIFCWFLSTYFCRKFCLQENQTQNHKIRVWCYMKNFSRAG
jgi:hypothetical protein